MIKKITALTMTAALLLTSMAACASSEPTDTANTTAASEEQETTAAETQPSDNLPETNMEGFEMRFYNYDDTYLTWSINVLDCAEQDGELINDAIYVRNRSVEDRFNAKITENTVSHVHDSISKLILAGDDFADIAMMYDETIIGHYSSGEFTSWDVLPYVALDMPWWNQDANNTFTIAGKQFAAVGDFSLSMYGRGFIILFNKDMYNNAALPENLYTLVSDGDWTFDKFGSISKNFIIDLNGDSVMDASDCYGIVGALKQVQGSFVTGGGVKYIETNSEGNPEFAIDGNEKYQNIMRSVLNVFAADTIYFNPVSDIHGGSTPSREMFFNNQALFVGSSTKGIANFRDMDGEIGILPFPKYNEAQQDYYILTSGGALATIPATVSTDRYENVSILLEALSFDSHYNLLSTYQETVLKTKYSRDSESEAMLDIIFDSAVFDLGLSIWPSATYYVYMEKVYAKNEDVIASTTESIVPKIAATIENVIADINA